MNELGLIFKDDNGDIMLGVFDEGIIESFCTISDSTEKYYDLKEYQFAVVDVEQNRDQEFKVSYLRLIDMIKHQKQITVKDFLLEMEFLRDDEFEETWAKIYAHLLVVLRPKTLH